MLCTAKRRKTRGVVERVVAHPYPATGRRVCRPGIMYVVLSRVRRWVDLALQDLTLHDLQLDKNSKAVKDWLALEATLDERDAITSTTAEYLTRQAAAAMEEEEEEEEEEEDDASGSSGGAW